LYLTDPSGTYISYDAIAIGANSDQVTDFLEKTYNNDLSLDDAAALATAGIYLSSEDKEGTDHIRMAQIKTETGLYEIITNEQITNFAKIAKEKYPHDQK
jgi:proteasome alpha subunit